MQERRHTIECAGPELTAKKRRSEHEQPSAGARSQSVGRSLGPVGVGFSIFFQLGHFLQLKEGNRVPLRVLDPHSRSAQLHVVKEQAQRFSRGRSPLTKISNAASSNDDKRFGHPVLCFADSRARMRRPLPPNRGGGRNGRPGRVGIRVRSERALTPREIMRSPPASNTARAGRADMMDRMRSRLLFHAKNLLMHANVQ